MIQSIYTSVSNADIVPCGKKGQKVSSEPIPLLRNNYLGEYRTELEKAKVRKNLGIADEQSLLWGNIEGHVEEQKDIIDYIKTMQEYTTDLNSSVTNVKEALDYILEFVTSFKGEEEAIKDILENIGTIHTHLTDLQNNLTTNSTNIGDLQSKYSQVEQDIADINKQIEKLNQDLIDINVDDKIQAWVTAKINSSSTLVLGDSLEVKISETEKNALSNDNGLFVQDLSEEVSEATQNIGELQIGVQNILNTYVTKDQLGGDGDYSFVKQEVFDTHTQQADTQFGELRNELSKTVKTGKDGHVSTLYVKQISKETSDNENINITNSFQMDQGIPLDVRFVVDTIDKLHSLDPSVCYAGMGVVVKNQASLYILREPADGVIDENYIKDEKGINWKCPEDLVIEVLTQEEYDKKVELGETSPHMFYYIHEEVVEEPRREQFDSDEAYTAALNKWLRVLQQQYMSAVWGQDIENLVASKASNEAVTSLSLEIRRLQNLIDGLSGGSSNVNLNSLNTQVLQNTSNINTLIKEDGIVPTLQNDLSKLKTSVEDNYVTKESITDESSTVEYIFVKKAIFDQYVKNHADTIAKELITNKVSTNEVLLNEATLAYNNANLTINNQNIALQNQVPVIECLDDKTFKDIEKSDNTYYYIYDDTDRYILDSEFSQYKQQQSYTVTTLFDNITKNKNLIGEITNLNTNVQSTIVLAINELVDKITQLDQEVRSLKEQLGITSN